MHRTPLRRALERSRRRRLFRVASPVVRPEPAEVLAAIPATAVVEPLAPETAPAAPRPGQDAGLRRP